MENAQPAQPDKCQQCGGQHGCCKKHKHHGGGGHGGCMGGLWFIGWLFTIGFLQLSFWKGVLALVIWPYYMGVFFR